MATQAPDCAGTWDPHFPFTPDVLGTVVKGWLHGGSNGCPDQSTVLSGVNRASSDVVQAAANAVAGKLSALRKQIYGDVISGQGLTAGTSQATNVEQAAQRLDGAGELLDGYVSLGLPQALASDDALRSLVSGANSDTFAPMSGGLAGAAPASGVPAQVVNLYKAAINDDQPNPIFPVTDAADVVASLVDQRASQLDGALNAHVVPTATPAAAGAAAGGHIRLSAAIVAPQTTGDVFAEENPYLGPTLDRLGETAFVLANASNAVATTTSTPPPNATPPSSGTPPAATKTAAKCTLRSVANKVLLIAPKGKPRKGAPTAGTLSLTIKCNQDGKGKLTGTLTQLIGGKLGKQKAKTYRLGPAGGTVRAGRVLSLTVKLPAAAASALRNGARESVQFTAVVMNANGSARATTKIAMLKGTR